MSDTFNETITLEYSRSTHQGKIKAYGLIDKLQSACSTIYGYKTTPIVYDNGTSNYYGESSFDVLDELSDLQFYFRIKLYLQQNKLTIVSEDPCFTNEETAKFSSKVTFTIGNKSIRR